MALNTPHVQQLFSNFNQANRRANTANTANMARFRQNTGGDPRGSNVGAMLPVQTAADQGGAGGVGQLFDPGNPVMTPFGSAMAQRNLMQRLGVGRGGRGRGPRTGTIIG